MIFPDNSSLFAFMRINCFPMGVVKVAVRSAAQSFNPSESTLQHLIWLSDHLDPRLVD